MLNKLRAKQTIVPLGEAFHVIEVSLVLWQDGNRIYELQWPRKVEDARKIAADFLESTRWMKESKVWLWELYLGYEQWCPVKRSLEEK